MIALLLASRAGILVFPFRGYGFSTSSSSISKLSCSTNSAGLSALFRLTLEISLSRYSRNSSWPKLARGSPKSLSGYRGGLLLLALVGITIVSGGSRKRSPYRGNGLRSKVSKLDWRRMIPGLGGARRGEGPKSLLTLCLRRSKGIIGAGPGLPSKVSISLSWYRPGSRRRAGGAKLSLGLSSKTILSVSSKRNGALLPLSLLLSPP